MPLLLPLPLVPLLLALPVLFAPPPLLAPLPLLLLAPLPLLGFSPDADDDMPLPLLPPDGLGEPPLGSAMVEPGVLLA